MPFSSAARSSFSMSLRSTPPWYLSARTVATITTASGRSPLLRHLMSTNFSAPETGLGHDVIGELHCAAGRDDRVAPVRDVGEWPAVNKGRIAFERLDQ